MISWGNSSISKIYLGDAEVQKIYLGTDLIYSAETPTGTYINYNITIGGYMYDIADLVFCFDSNDPEDSSLGYLVLNGESRAGTLEIDPSALGSWEPFFIWVPRDTYSSADGSCTGTFNGTTIPLYRDGENAWLSDELHLSEGANTLNLEIVLND